MCKEEPSSPQSLVDQESVNTGKTPDTPHSWLLGVCVCMQSRSGMSCGKTGMEMT
jgi:hypothetical protein